MSSIPPPWRTASAPTGAFPTATPAYTTVPARRSLRTHNPNPSVSNEAHQSAMSTTDPSPPPTQFSPAIRAYVQRCFAPENQIPGITLVQMQERLRELITDAARKNLLNAIKWESRRTPQEEIFAEQANSGVSSRPSSQPASIGDASRKRKPTDSHQLSDINSPPWRNTNNTSIEGRVTYPSKQKKPCIASDASSKSKANLEMRKKRFEGAGATNGKSATSSPQPEVDQGPVVGRCETLEKNYFRLTSAPNPDTVRPLPVLRMTLDLLKKKWRKEGNYGYICDQFKSLRQDLTVQHIRNEFTVSVYEIHARIALEKGDLGEYNQCQTQLRVLYSQQLGGNPTEFKAYRILYFIYTRNWTAMNDVLADVTAEDKKDPAVKHALNVRSALALGNYHRFFLLYLDTPNMGAYLMDMFVERERLSALAAICRAYKPDVKIRFITEELGFESDEQTARFVIDHSSAELLQEKDGEVKLLAGKAGGLFEQAKADAYRVVDIKGQI
ncbi:hypothetical protein N7490_008656 [Penicillium lividum]|nr:hypothetical protein N7490_008656 [Penicillium lividum]